MGHDDPWLRWHWLHDVSSSESVVHARRSLILSLYQNCRKAAFGRLARVPAAEIEKMVVDQVRILLLSPEIIVQTWRATRKSIKDITEAEVRGALQTFDPLWNELFPAEQARIIDLLVERVDIRTDRVDIKLRIAGVTSLVGELTGHSVPQRDAA